MCQFFGGLREELSAVPRLRIEFALAVSSGAADLGDFAGLDFFDCREAGWEIGPEVFKTVGRTLESYDRDSAPC